MAQLEYGEQRHRLRALMALPLLCRATRAHRLRTSGCAKNKTPTTRSVQNMVKKYVRATGITKAISPHSIRHTVGTNMALNEAPLLVIQQFLGHSDPKTSMRYIRHAEDLVTRANQYNTQRSLTVPVPPGIKPLEKVVMKAGQILVVVG